MNFRRLWCSLLSHPALHLRMEADPETATVYEWCMCDCGRKVYGIRPAVDPLAPWGPRYLTTAT